MSALEIFLGPSITEFASDRFPTLRDVLCFYSQHWNSHGSESQKQKLVAQELIKVYNRNNIPVLSEKGIKNKIKRNVDNLKIVLKFQTKKRTAENMQRETTLRSQLDETFEIRHQNIQSGTRTSNDDVVHQKDVNTNNFITIEENVDSNGKSKNKYHLSIKSAFLTILMGRLNWLFLFFVSF